MMKQYTRMKFGGIAVAFFIAIMIPVNAPACVSMTDIAPESFNGAWEPTDETVFAFEFIGGNGNTYIYDFGSPERNLEILSGSPHSTIYFTELSDGESSTWYADAVSGGQSLLLGDDPNFGISFSKDGRTSLDYYLSGTSGAYALKDQNSATAIFVHDAEPIHTPIPSAALLLGTGLFGLAANRIRARNN